MGDEKTLFTLLHPPYSNTPWVGMLKPGLETLYPPSQLGK